MAEETELEKGLRAIRYLGIYGDHAVIPSLIDSALRYRNESDQSHNRYLMSEHWKKVAEHHQKTIDQQAKIIEAQAEMIASLHASLAHEREQSVTKMESHYMNCFNGQDFEIEEEITDD